MKELCKVVVVCVIISFYSWQMALISIGCVAPSIYVTRNALAWMMSSGVLVQGAKAEMSATVEESLTNIKTVKAFAEEKSHVTKFEKANWFFSTNFTRSGSVSSLSLPQSAYLVLLH